VPGLRVHPPAAAGPEALPGVKAGPCEDPDGPIGQGDKGCLVRGSTATEWAPMAVGSFLAMERVGTRINDAQDRVEPGLQSWPVVARCWPRDSIGCPRIVHTSSEPANVGDGDRVPLVILRITR